MQAAAAGQVPQCEDVADTTDNTAVAAKLAMRPPVLPPLTLSAALLAIGAPAAVAPQIQIGGSNGWIVQGAYDDVTAAVGDVLSFSYTAGYHDVMLIQEGNDACDFSGGSLLDETGSFQFTLTEPGEFVFACTKGSHCAGGAQHVRVSVPAPAAESGGQQQVGPPTIEQLDSMCPAEMAACRSARNCMGPLETSLLPENSEEPPSGTAEIDAIVACFMQGMMSEAFGPCLGGPPGGGVGVGLPVGPVGPTEMCPDSPPQMCRRMCPELAPDACAAGQCMMRQGSCCDMECAALGGGGGGGNCAAGDDCGGQERTDCGTSCPPICGEPPAQFCVFMCFVGYQCPVRSPRPLRTVRACFPLA